MKSQIVKLIARCFLILIVFASCSKEPLVQAPLPEKQSSTPEGNLAFSSNLSLSGAPYHSSNLQAVVTLVNKDNQVVVDEKMLTLDLNGGIRSEAVRLPVGTYQLTRFRLVYGSVNTHFAVPVTGSAKAAGVQNPLPLSINVSAAGGVIPVEVIRVAESEAPQAFGYPVGSFDNHQEENNPYIKVKIKATMKIGDVVYDSIPASLVLTTWNQQGEMSTSYLSLKAGVNEVPVAKAASKYKFRMTRWGVSDELTLERKNADAATVYVLGGSKEAKKLTSEATYEMVGGQYVAESKTDYVYNLGGRLHRVYRYRRNAQNKTFMAMAEHFQYSGNKLEKISRYDDKNVLLGSTTFSYNQQGKVNSMVQLENGRQINATVGYLQSPDSKIEIQYAYSDQTYTKGYGMTLSGGNVISGTDYVAGQLGENGLYDYDSEINPYVHMNWPDIYFSNFSKNNLVKQYKYYHGAMPLTDPYGFSYTYDAEGYPKELVKKIWSLPGKQHVKTTKTVYTY